MDKWVLLEHEVYNAKSKDVHYEIVESFIIKKCPGCKYCKT